jgi:hypothetical protein
MLVLAVVSLILVSVPASLAAHAATMASAPTVKVASSGIGLPVNLPSKGVGVLQNSTYYERASKSGLWGQTPAGLVFRSCIYGVPNSSYVDSIHDRIILPDGRVLPMKPCPYPRLTPPNVSTATKSTAATGGTLSGNTANWIDGFEADGLPQLGYLTADLSAPYPPTLVNSALWEYQWTALGSLSANSLLQPAVGWGKLDVSTYRAPLSGDTEMAAYYYWSGNAIAGTFYSVKPLDTLSVSIQAYNCGSGGGDCTWWMQITDESSLQDSQLTVGSSPAYTSVFGELESNVGTQSGLNCQSLFANHHLVWRNLLVQTESATTVLPDYYDTGYFDFGAGENVWNASGMNTLVNNADTAADTTWSNACTSF